MKTTIAYLRLPSPWTGRPADIAARYGDGRFDFDTADRAASSEEHRLLFEAVAAAKKAGRCGWFHCACRDDIELAVMVRARQPLPYLALMPGTSLQHRPWCAFHRAPITSHVSDAITEDEDGALRVRLNFRLGMPPPDKEPGATIINEGPLRTRQAPTRQLNKFGLDGLLRLLFSEAGLHRWPRRDRTTAAAAAGSWKPIYARLLHTLGRIDAQGQRSGALKAYTRIGMPGTVAAFESGTVLALVDVIEKVEPSKKHNWKCYLAGWEGRFLIISPDQVRALLKQLRFHPDRAKTTLTEKLTILPRPTEVWWGCLLVRVEGEQNDKWYRVLDQAVLRTDWRGIPAESLAEIEMTQHLIDEDRSFCKPLFGGELLAVPKRRPDFILEDTAEQCCVEVAGMDGVYDYDDRDDERLDEYDKAGVRYKRWKPKTAWPVLDGEFRPLRSRGPSGAPLSVRPSQTASTE
jgi:hypothetical protein